MLFCARCAKRWTGPKRSSRWITCPRRITSSTASPRSNSSMPAPSLERCAAQQRDHGRLARVVVRVGDYKQDSFIGTGEGSIDLVPCDDDVLAIRHRIWLATDRAYKSASEALSAKQAALKQLKVDEPVDDFAKATPVGSDRAARAFFSDRLHTLAASSRRSFGTISERQRFAEFRVRPALHCGEPLLSELRGNGIPLRPDALLDFDLGINPGGGWNVASAIARGRGQRSQAATHSRTFLKTTAGSWKL